MGEKIDKNKLTIPIYLNTKIVFDMLATIEDGFSEVKNIQTSKSKNREEESLFLKFFALPTYITLPLASINI